MPGEEHEPQQWSSEDDLAVLAAAAAAAAATAIPEALAFKFRRRRRPLYPLLRFVLSLPFPLFYKFDATLLNTLTQTHGPLDISFVPGQPVAAFDTADDSGNETGKAKPAFKIPAKYDIYTGRREKKKSKSNTTTRTAGLNTYNRATIARAARPPQRVSSWSAAARASAWLLSRLVRSFLPLLLLFRNSRFGALIFHVSVCPYYRKSGASAQVIGKTRQSSSRGSGQSWRGFKYLVIQ